MPGGLLQLVAYGAQDAYLSGNPQITFWKGLYKRHTNFAMEPFRVNLTGQANWGVKHSAILGRHADLLYSTYIEVVLDDGYYNNAQGRLGYNLLKYVELDIGGQIIDRIYGEWLYLWDALTSDYNTSIKLWRMVGGEEDSGPVEIENSQTCTNGRLASPKVLYIPLYFFYTKNPGAALPLIALQYHEVKINIQWNDVKTISGNFSNNAVYSSTNQEGFPKQPLQAAVYVDYIYLDTEERRRMAQQSHEYLIEQTQYNEEKGITSFNNRIDLTFNHPVKELVWVVQPSNYTDCKLPDTIHRSFGGGGSTCLAPFGYLGDVVFDQWLQINGQDRLDKRYGDYYNKVQPYQHHTGILGTYNSAGYSSQGGIYCYSFALRPEEHQPSGSCNFSRIDTATIVMNLAGLPANYMSSDDDVTWSVRVYAVNYNILRVMSGMAGLAYSN